MESTHVDQVKTFVTKHLKDEFSLNQLAEQVGYSAFHLAREFKLAVGLTVMEFTRVQRVLAAAEELGHGRSICDVAMEYCFETHAGFTRAFNAEFGCTPREYQRHARRMDSFEKGVVIMENTNIVIRHICKDDVQDLWENVYSAMTPRQITEDKILPAIEAYKRGEGLELVAQVDGRVVMSLPLSKERYLPLGFLWNNNFTLTGGGEDRIMSEMMEEMKTQARRMGIFTLISPQAKDSPPSQAMQSFGFQKVMQSGDWEYLMMAI